MSVKVYSLETGYIKDTYLPASSENGLITALRGEDLIIVAGYETGAICAWDKAGMMSYIPPLTGRAPAKVREKAPLFDLLVLACDLGCLLLCELWCGV